MAVQDQEPLVERPQQHAEPKASGDLSIGKLAISALLLACFLANGDESFVLTTGSDVAAELDAPSSASWLITGYNLGYILALPMYGKLCDLAGPKRSILLALAVYAAGCLITGLSGTIFLAVAGRIIAGFGGAGMNEIVSVLINENNTFERVAMLRSYVTTISVLGCTCGAPLGAFLTSWIGWQWAFLVHIPFATACIIVIALRLSSPKPQLSIVAASTYGAIETYQVPEKIKSKPFDVFGLLSLVIAIVSFLGFVQAIESTGLENKLSYVMICVASAAISFAIFCLIETCWAEEPIIPFSLFKSNQLGLIYSAQIFIGIAQFGTTTMLSDFWVSAEGFSVSEGAVCFIPSALGFACGSLITGKLIQRTQNYLRWSIMGSIISISSFTLILIRWTLYQPNVWELAYSFPAWFGTGMLLSSQFTAISAAKPDENAATSVTTYYFAQQIGFMTGITTVKSLVMKEIRHRLSKALGNGPDSVELINEIMSSRRSADSLPPSLQILVRHVIQRSYLVAPAVGISSFLIAFFIILRQKEVKSL